MGLVMPLVHISILIMLARQSPAILLLLVSVRYRFDLNGVDCSMVIYLENMAKSRQILSILILPILSFPSILRIKDTSLVAQL